MSEYDPKTPRRLILSNRDLNNIITFDLKDALADLMGEYGDATLPLGWREIRRSFRTFWGLQPLPSPFGRKKVPSSMTIPFENFLYPPPG